MREVFLLRDRVWLLLVLLLWMSGAAVCAQDAATGALRGEIAGPDGRSVPHATVRLQDADGRVAYRVVHTDAAGRYLMPAVPPGRYRLAVDAAGFAGGAPDDVVVVLGETARVDVILHVGLQESVTVRAEGEASPDPFVAATDTTVRPDEVRELPVEGRRWQDLAVMAARVNPVSADEARVSAAGVAVTQNRFTLDGVRDTRAFSGEARGGHRLSLGNAQGGVREFRVVTSGMGAEGVGAAFHVVTRKGEARRGGSAFVQERTNLFAAVDPSAVVTRYNGGAPTVRLAQPQDTRVQWGVALFGAVPRVRGMTGHVAFEQERRDYPAVSSPGSPTFYALSARQVALLQTRGVGLLRQKEALEYLDSLSGDVPRRAEEWSLLPRVDWSPGPRAALSVTWSHSSRNAPAGLYRETVVHRGVSSYGDDRISTDAVVAQWSQEISSRATNRVLFGYSRDLERQEAQESLPQEPHTGPNGFSPQVSLGGDFVFGKPSSLGRRRYPDERRVQVGETFWYAAHGWVLQVGGSVSQVEERISSLSNEEGSYAYANSTTGGHAGALVDWMTDWAFPSSAYPNGACPAIYAPLHYFCFRWFTQSFGAESIAFGTGEMNGFVQMHWRPVAPVAVTAGVRYERYALPPAQHPNAALDALFGDEATTTQMPADGNNVAPYAAVAWGTKKTVVRVSAGVSYGRVPGATVWAALARTAMPESVRTVRIGPQTVVDTTCASAGNVFGYPSTYVCAPGTAPLRTTSAVMFTRNFAMPAVGQAQMSVEQQVGGATLSATYTGFAARALPNSTDLNIAPGAQMGAFRVERTDGGGEAGVRHGDTFVLPVYSARVNASFGAVTEVLSNASASHHSLSVAMQRRLRNGWSARAEWTYAKTLDFGQDHGALPLVNGQLDPFNVRYDRAASDLDRRHRVVFAGFYTSRWSGRSLQARVLDGWTVAPLFTASAGRPYSYLISGGTSLSGGTESINGAGGLRYLPSVGRNTLRLPWSTNLNLRVARRLRVRDALRMQVYADAFNLLNANNVSRVQQRAFLVGDKANGVTPLVFQDAAAIAAEGLTTQAFGTAMGTGTLLARQREFQFGLRVEW